MRILLVILLTMFCVSCAKQRTVTVRKKENKFDLQSRYAGGFKVGKDEQGNVKMISNKVSSFDKRAKNSEAKSFGKKEFKSKAFQKKDWRQNKEYKANRFDKGEENRFAKNSSFDQNRSKFSQLKSNNSGRKYFTNPYATHSANESGRNRKHIVDAETSGPRRTYDDYTITSQSDYRKRSIEETRSLLGRDD